MKEKLNLALTSTKNAYKKNKISFILFSVALGLFIFAFVAALIPTAEEYRGRYGWYVDYFNSFTFSIIDIFTVLALSLTLSSFFINNGKTKRTLKTIAYISIILAFSHSFFYSLFCEFATDYDSFLLGSGNIWEKNILPFIADVLSIIAFTFLLVIHTKKPKSNVVSYILWIVIGILILISFIFYVPHEFETTSDIFSMYDTFGIKFGTIVSYFLYLCIPLFVLGDFFYQHPIKPFDKKMFSSELEQELYALKIKLEIGSITKEEFEEKKKVLFDSTFFNKL